MKTAEDCSTGGKAMTETESRWAQFALLLIDVQQDFYGAKMAELYPHFPANVTQLLKLCRAQGIAVIHLRVRFRADGADWMVRYRLRGRIPCVEGTPGVETLPFAREDPGETVIIKHAFDGFQEPGLLQHLRQSGKRFVLAAGLVTSTCVLFTTVSAAQNGFLTAVLEDCCADEPSAHQQTLERYHFIFDRTTVEHIVDRHAEWSAALDRLDDVERE
jgi:nicotinamidase-related amidase